MKHILLIIFFAVFSSACAAQPLLPRSTFLGVSPTSLNSGDELIVASLHPRGTGALVGLKEGDQILSINQHEVSDFHALSEILSDIYEENEIQISVLRDDSTVTLSGNAIARPPEAGSGYTAEYGAFTWRDNHIRTITYHPENQRQDNAAVMFIQGYTCSSIDYGMAPNLTMNQLLEAYAQAGFTVFKMEKPGVGDSQGNLNCSEYDFDTENAAFLAGLEFFASQPSVNEDNLFVFGHSLGVLHSAIIAEKGIVKGVMGYGGLLKSWYDYMQIIMTDQATLYWGVDEQEAQQNLQNVEPFLEQWLNTNNSWETILEDSGAKRVIDEQLLPISGEQVFQRHYTFFRSLNQYDFRAQWDNTEAHALLMHGSFDIQAINSDWAFNIAEIINQNNPDHATALVIENTEHALMSYPSLQALQTAMRDRTHSPSEPGEHYNPEIATASLAWMQKVLEEHD